MQIVKRTGEIVDYDFNRIFNAIKAARDSVALEVTDDKIREVADAVEEAIEHYENLENPTAQTCITLAAFYEVREHLYPVDTGQSYDAPPIYRSDTKFGQMVGSRDPGMVYGLIDELLDKMLIVKNYFLGESEKEN